MHRQNPDLSNIKIHVLQPWTIVAERSHVAEFPDLPLIKVSDNNLRIYWTTNSLATVLRVVRGHQNILFVIGDYLDFFTV